jgi:hypothetical protein
MSLPLQNVILDPSEVSVAGRSEISLAGLEGVTVAHEGIDWGTQEVKQFLSEGLFGSRPIDQAWPMRSVKLPLHIRPTATATFDDVRVALEQWVAAANLEGGWLKRILPSGRYGFLDVIEAKLHLSASWQAENRDFDNEAALELQTLPEFYGPVVTGTAHEFTGDGAFTMNVEGEIPARVEEMLVEDKSGNSQLGLMWHYRRRHYSSANTAEWAYNAEALGLLDIAEKVANPGGVAYGTKVVKHPKLSTDWTPALSTNKGGSTFLTHTGLYTVWARVYATSESLPWLRLVYGVGDVVAPQENVQVQVPGKEGWYLVNLGQVNIRELPFGAQRWEGVVQARTEGTGSTEAIYVDRLWFQCADECSGVLGALTSTTALASMLASDRLVTHSSEGKEEALNGTEDSRGHKWEDAAAGEGFFRTTSGGSRATISDSSARSALLAGSIGPLVLKGEAPAVIRVNGMIRGFYLRYFSSTYWVRVVFKDIINGFAGDATLAYIEYQAGGSTSSTYVASVQNAVSFEGELNAAGEIVLRMEGTTYRSTLPATFKKGEAHAEGKIGIYDYNPTTTPVTRRYLNLVASAPPPSDAVMYSNKAAYLSMTGMYRESEDGLGASPIGHPGSDLPRLPVSGPEETPVEIAVKPSRGQFGELADVGKDKAKVQVSYRPCYASIPAA